MTTPIDRPNRDAIIQALDIFRDAMRPFIVRNLRSVHGKQPEDMLKHSLRGSAANFEQRLNRDGKIEGAIDLNDIPKIVKANWHDVFNHAFNYDLSTQNMLWLIVGARNDASHPGLEDMSLQYVEAILTHIAEVLGRINELDNKRRVEAVRDGLRRAAESAPAQASKPSPAPEQPPKRRARKSKASARPPLKPWRQVIRPNPDIESGEFAQDEYAANLQRVHDGNAPIGYLSPVRFFEQTHITAGIRSLLVNTLKRISGNGGDPVIQTRTGFGGGKTHSLIAIHHVVNEHRALLTPADSPVGKLVAKEIGDIITEAGMNPNAEIDAKIAVLDGNHLSPTDARATDNGDPLNTLWGVMAWQLGGQAAYDIIGAAARAGSAPGGDQLNALFAHVGPSVILMDEIVSYARNAGVDWDSIYTFVQNLTQSVSGSENVALVVTLPESNIEAGGERGQQALNTLGHTFARIDALWTPLEVDEAYQVVRRRLFGAEIDVAERDRTCEAFHRLYTRQRREYTAGSHEPRYLAAMKACYPIHPEVFTRLYGDWSSHANFQRTRGVLRLMTNWISRLYIDGDASPLIMPANLPLSASSVAGEFTRALGQGQWQPVISEADSDGSRTDVIDRMTGFAEMGGAARRLARTIFFGSARSGSSVGIDIHSIMLGVMQPDHQPAQYKDALERMSDTLYYLYVDGSRYYFHVEENLNKVAIDRAGQLQPEEITAFITAELKKSVGRRSDVIVCPELSDDVPDTDALRLVIAPPDSALKTRASETDRAGDFAKRILLHRGAAPRVRKNGILFLAAKSDDIRVLRHAAAMSIAWSSIVSGDRQIANLTGQRAGQARAQLDAARKNFHNLFCRAYSRALTPTQPNPKEPVYDLIELPTDAPDTGEIINAALDACIQSEALIPRISPPSLQNMLNRFVWSGDAQERYHVGINELWEMMRCQVYMHRLSDKSTLLECFADGVRTGVFGYAASCDDGNNYIGMRMDPNLTLADIAETGLIVRQDMAEIVIQDMTERAIAETPPTPAYTAEPPEGGYPATTLIDDAPPQRPVMRRIRASKTLTGSISNDDFADIRAEIVHNLNADGADVEVEIIVRASKPDGFSENALRAANDNSKQLGMEIQTGE